MNKNEEDDTPKGPVESFPWPQRISAHVVAPGPAPRLHGYDVQGDLALNYRFSDTVYLALTGHLPDEAQSRSFDIVLIFLSPCSVAEAPAHAAVLARLCVAPDAGVIQVGAMGLAEQSAFLVHQLASVHAWLKEPTALFPSSNCAADDAERASVARLRDRLGERAREVSGLEHDPSLPAALVCTLYACGLQTLEQWTTALVLARLPIVAAEAFAASPGDFRGYPMDLPHFCYEGGEHER